MEGLTPPFSRELPLYDHLPIIYFFQTFENLFFNNNDLSVHKWSTTHRLLKFHRSKMSVIYMLWKQCALRVITTMALWQLMHLGTWLHIMIIYIYIYIYKNVHISKRDDNLGKKWPLLWLLKFHIDYFFQLWFFIK